MMLASEITDVINADIADCSSSPALGCLSSVPCSICLDLVIDDGERSIAKLHCGHKFHLDCIGSAFNTKGAMQCPNCRKVESGRWLFADGSSHAVYEAGARDRMPYEGPHDLSYFRRPIGFHWHRFGGFMVHPLIEETESSLNTFANFLGNYAMITEHAAGPSSTRAYISYLQPIEHVDNSNFHHFLNSHPAPRNSIRSTYIQHPRWGWNCHFPYYNGNLSLTATRRSTHARTQPIHYTRHTRDGSMVNSHSHERHQIHHMTHQHHDQPSEVTNMPSPMILPAVPGQPHNRVLHSAYISETESDESAYVPIMLGSFRHHWS